MANKRRLSKRFVLIALAVVLVVSLAVFAYWFFVYRSTIKDDSDEGPFTSTVVGEEEIAIENEANTQQLQAVQKNTLKDTASTEEKRQYYTDLIIAADANKDYALVTANYKKSQEQGVEFTKLDPYLSAARAYAAQNDINEANKTLATATAWVDARANTPQPEIIDGIDTIEYWRMMIDNVKQGIANETR